MERIFPVSESSFAELVRKENGQYFYYFVDKTLFIKDILQKPRRVYLIARPRRFGKSLNLKMLQCFFDIHQKEANKGDFRRENDAGSTACTGCTGYTG